jgi:hypothetical protein
VVAALGGRLAADAVVRGVAGLPGALLGGAAGGVAALVVVGVVLAWTERATLEPVLLRLRHGSRRSEKPGHDRTEMHDHREEGGGDERG